ncbi:hypothetical protein M2283_008830 [Streptomyces pseudovenezuelae]|uniref:HTH cro/C1-type domain-containing protein n=1 Tax=Streptomyces pseudovenezuelae TaxID=67350 RepID=A0ABT6LYV1_9ACTN|nr:hypothetical protein [Streptomyces pseudovenezuelae]
MREYRSKWLLKTATCMPNLDDDHTGARIREQRRLARLTLRGLAGRIPYSYSYLTQVECGAHQRIVGFTSGLEREQQSMSGTVRIAYVEELNASREQVGLCECCGNGPPGLAGGLRE